MGSNPSQQSKCDKNEAGKKALHKLSHSASYWDEYFVTEKWQLILHPGDLCPLLLQAKKFIFWYSCKVHCRDMTETREVSWI